MVKRRSFTAKEVSESTIGMLATPDQYSEAIVNVLSEAVLVLNEQFVVRAANPSYYRTFNSSRTETENISLFRLTAARWDDPKIRQVLELTLTRNRRFENLEIPLLLSQGDDRVFLLDASRVKLRGEKMVILTLRDITDTRNLSVQLQKKEQQRLSELLRSENKTRDDIERSEKRYNMLIMKSPFAISILKGKEMVIMLANDSMKEMWGKGYYIEGKPLTKVIPELKGQPYPELLEQVYKTGTPFFGSEMPTSLNRKGRIEHLYINFVCQPYLEADETISGVTIIAYDVTAQVNAKKNAEKAHLKQKDELEKAVRRRTRQLEQKNLELERANKDLTTFTYVSSHDLQEPLRKMQNFVTHLMRTEVQNLSGEGKLYFSKISETARRMQSLIEDLLTYSQAKNTAFKFQKADLNVLVEEVIMDLEDRIKDKCARLIVRKLGKVKILPFQFRQLIYNLISNSLKFSKPGRAPHISIRSRTETGAKLKALKLSSKKKYCHIIYTDNGIGFDAQYNERIFEVFQRLHGYEEYKGTGIGLAICKRIIENHRGLITASGKPNRGARFDVYLPTT